MKSLVIDYIKNAVRKESCRDWVLFLADKNGSEYKSEFRFGTEGIQVGLSKRNSFIIKDDTVRFPSGNFKNLIWHAHSDQMPRHNKQNLRFLMKTNENRWFSQ